MKKEVFAEEGVYYKVNRAIIKKGNKFYLRNTWTGEETEIPRPVAMNIKLEWKKMEKVC